MREKLIEQKLVKAVKALNGMCPKLVSPGTDGMPDRMVLLPENWDELNVYQRREFIRDTEDPTRPRGTVHRKVVSNIEIWCECFGKNKEDLRPSDSYAISAIMVRMRGWNKTSEREWLPIYGRQRVYKRDGE